MTEVWNFCAKLHLILALAAIGFLADGDVKDGVYLLYATFAVFVAGLVWELGTHLSLACLVRWQNMKKRGQAPWR